MQQRFTAHKPDRDNVAKQLAQSLDVPLELIDLRKNGGGYLTVVSTSAAVQVAVINQMDFQVGKNAGKAGFQMPDHFLRNRTLIHPHRLDNINRHSNFPFHWCHRHYSSVEQPLFLAEHSGIITDQLHDMPWAKHQICGTEPSTQLFMPLACDFTPEHIGVFEAGFSVEFA